MKEEKDRGEVVLYQPNDTIRLEVRLDQETVWLTQYQLSILFGKDRSVITRHIKNIFNQGELDSKSNVHFLHIPNSDKPVKFYNLDVILSVGYRVHSTQGILFRRWSSSVLKQYLLRGYSINQQLIQMEDRIDRRLESQHDEIQRIKEIQEKQQSQIDFFVRTSLPPVEGVFFDGQMWVGASIKDLGKKWTAIYLRKYSETMENCIHSFVCRYWAASAAVAERQRDFTEVEAAEPPPVSVSGGRILPDREMSRSDRGLRSPGTCEAKSPRGHTNKATAYAMALSCGPNRA